MKKILFSLVAFVAIFSQNAMAQTAKVLLSHNGNVTLYDASAFSTAIADAAAGDTLYLSEGGFTGNRTINQKITIIGAGETSIIDGDVTVNISGTANFSSVLMEGVKITGTFNVASATNGLRIRSCKINTSKITATANNATFEKCFITNSFYADPSYVKSMTVTNSKIYGVGGACSNVTFVNCNIYKIYDSSFAATLLNSILNMGSNYRDGSYSYITLSSACYLTNCLYNSWYIDVTNAVTKGCWYYRTYDGILNSSTLERINCTDALNGNDGTPIGVYGGTTPYTLRPSAPYVTSSSVKVDNATQTLNVNIKVKAN